MLSVLLALVEDPYLLFCQDIWRVDSQILAEARRLQVERRIFFEISLARAGRYLPIIEKEIRDQRLPPELAYLPIVESGFDPLAVSHRGAGGLWQLMPMTARGLGLRVDTWVDERFHPVKSTSAALHLLYELYAYYGDWPLALAAYNAGAGRVNRALYRASFRRRRRRGVRARWEEAGDIWDFWSIRRYLRRETRDYVPLFYAAVLAAREWGVTPRDPWPGPFDTLVVEGSVDLLLVADLLGVAADEIQLLNPELVSLATPPDTAYTLRIPPGTRDSLARALARVPEREVVVWSYYRVRRGDSWWRIAKRYGVSVRELQRANRGGRRRARLRRGRYIRVPIKVRMRSARDEIWPVRMTDLTHCRHLATLHLAGAYLWHRNLFPST